LKSDVDSRDQAPMQSPMIAVVGLWHLGSVTAACMAAAGFSILGYDEDARTIAKLGEGQPPLFEPGLRPSRHSPGAFLQTTLGSDTRIRYVKVGRAE